MGLRGKIILALVVVMAAGFALAGFLSSRQFEQLLESEVQARGRALLTAMAPPCAIAMANGEFEDVDLYLGQVGDQKRADLLGLEYLMVLDHQGRIYSHSDSTRFGQRPPDLFYTLAQAATAPTFRVIRRDSKASLLEATVPIVSGVRYGTLVVGFSMAREEQTLLSARAKVVPGAAALAAACGLLLLVLLTLTILTPVKRLTEAADAYALRKLEHRVVLGGDDELTRLGGTFNKMAGELLSYTQDLEKKLEIRAAEVVAKNRELTEVNQKLSAAVQQLEKLAITDGLTGLFNHRHFQETLSFELTRSQRASHPASVVMIDVDHFKHYNDHNGHPAGDKLLRTLAEIFRGQLRSVDLVARYGGEEFVILLLDTDLDAALAVAEKIRKRVEHEPFPNGESQPLGRLTISVGVASFARHGSSPGQLVEAADQALYRAKHGGRNRVEVAQEWEARHG